MWWWDPAGFAPFLWFVPWLLFVLLFAFLVSRVFTFRHRAWGPCGWRGGSFEPEAILKRRLASGEISEADYQWLREHMTR